jgi:hypothetical protein
MNTLLLDQSDWDLVLDINGNIAMANAPYALAQDVASAIKVFIGDLWYGQATGIPYLTQVLGQEPNPQFLRSQVEAAALTVPGVVQARCLFVELNSDRVLRGQVQFIDTDGVSRNVTL